MKKFYLLATALFCTVALFAQEKDSTIVKDSVIVNDSSHTIFKVGTIVFKKKGPAPVADTIPKKPSRIKTEYFVVDLGFANYNDQTNYAGISNPSNYLVDRPTSAGFTENDFKLKTGKSVHLNIWFVMQQLALIKQNVHLKYGLGIELNNYRYKQSISYKESGSDPYRMTFAPQPGAFIFRDSIQFSKNKLAADYLTVPLMLTFGTTKAQEKKGISVGVGISAGYLYSQRNKQESDERGKQKNKGDYDLERFKFSYVGELGIGPVKLYGSYSPTSMYDNELDIRPYTFGIRLNSW